VSEKTNSSALPLDGSALAHGNAAVGALEALLSTLRVAAHPQDFDIAGCPGCKAMDELRETTDALHRAMERIEKWQPGAAR